MSEEIVVVTPIDLHPAQQQILFSPARFRVASCGRRFGKTMMAAVWLTIYDGGSALAGKRCAWFAPTYKQMIEIWHQFNRSLTDVIERSSRTEMRIELVTGGIIECWTLEDIDAGRGRKYHRVVIDEAAHARLLREAWEQSILPTLTDYRGEAIIVSTPNGLNYFYELWQRGQRGDEGWASFQMPTTVNPYIDASVVEAAREVMSELVWRQEYLAEFVDIRGSALIKREWLRYYDQLPKLESIAIGVDLAISRRSSADYTCAVVMGRSAEGNLYVIDVWRARATMPQTVAVVSELAGRYNASTIAVESVAYQQAVADELMRTTSLAIKPIKPTTDKVMRAQALASRFEHGLVYLPRRAAWLRAYEQELISFPVADHDDQVDATVYAMTCVSHTPTYRALVV